MARFAANRLGIKRVTFDTPMRQWAQSAAAEVAAMAKTQAPVRTGNYRKSIKPTTVLTSDGWVGRVNAFDFKALWVELGTNGITKRRVLAGALDAAGVSARVEPGKRGRR